MFINCPEILGATLLSKEEAKTLLKKDKRTYGKNWWLRTPGDDNYYACFVNFYGYLDTIGQYVYYDIFKVRPALKIDISTSDIQIGDIFIFGDKEFKVISPELAWMYNDDIGECVFREDWTAEDANIYEASDVKKFVDAWFEKAREETK